MKSYHIQNYIRYKKDLEQALKRLPNIDYQEYTEELLVVHHRLKVAQPLIHLNWLIQTYIYYKQEE